MCEGCEERIHVGHQVHRIDRSISKLLEMRKVFWYLPFSSNKYYPDAGEKRVHLPCIGCK